MATSAWRSTSRLRTPPVTVIAMIEDPEAIDDIADIVAVDGIDGFFVGRADLAGALSETAQDAVPVHSATEMRGPAKTI